MLKIFPHSTVKIACKIMDSNAYSKQISHNRLVVILQFNFLNKAKNVNHNLKTNFVQLSNLFQMEYYWILFALLIQTTVQILKTKTQYYQAGIIQYLSNNLGHSVFQTHLLHGHVNTQSKLIKHLFKEVKHTLWFKLSSMVLITMFFLLSKCMASIKIFLLVKAILIPIFIVYFLELLSTFLLSMKLYYFFSPLALMMDQ